MVNQDNITTVKGEITMDYLFASIQTITTSLIVGLLVFFLNRKIGKRIDKQESDLKCAKEQSEKAEQKQTSLESGVRSMIRSNIILSYDKAMDRGYIPHYERESILSSYHDYKVLGGNGMVDHLMEEMEALGSVPPIKIRRTKKQDTSQAL